MSRRDEAIKAIREPGPYDGYEDYSWALDHLIIEGERALALELTQAKDHSSANEYHGLSLLQSYLHLEERALAESVGRPAVERTTVYGRR